jgi:hypothetical protein
VEAAMIQQCIIRPRLARTLRRTTPEIPMKKPNSNQQKRNKLVLKRHIIQVLTSPALAPIRGGTEQIAIDCTEIPRCLHPIYSA